MCLAKNVPTERTPKMATEKFKPDMYWDWRSRVKCIKRNAIVPRAQKLDAIQRGPLRAQYRDEHSSAYANPKAGHKHYIIGLAIDTKLHSVRETVLFFYMLVDPVLGFI